MNTRKLQNNVGQTVEVWPGGDEWLLERAEPFVELRHSVTDHLLKIGHDRVRDFREPRSLILRGQPRRQGQRCWLEPLLHGDHHADILAAAERIRQLALRAGVPLPPVSAFLSPPRPRRTRLGRRRGETKA